MILKLSPNADNCNKVVCRIDIGLFKRGVYHDDQFDVSSCFLLPMMETPEVKFPVACWSTALSVRPRMLAWYNKTIA
jgi:hypothetical protein